jgi:hypothetical protein
VKSADFGAGAKKFEARVASVSKGNKIEVRLNDINGKLLGTCKIKNTGGWQNWKTTSCKLQKVEGVHDICFVFKGNNGQLFNFDWWKFKK